MAFISQYFIYVILLAGAALSIIKQKLTVTGGTTGFVVAVLIFNGAGYTGIVMLAMFFIAGSAATGWQAGKKQLTGMTDADSQRRTAGQVIANGGVAAVLGGVAWFHPAFAHLLQPAIAGSLAAATADTLSSELGTLYGRRFYDILTFKSANPGADGVVSIEGTLIGVLGAVAIAAVYAVGLGYNNLVWIIVFAGAAGNLADSILGATLERNGLMGNNAVNFLNTCTGAGICLLAVWLFK